jgi:hypothetical protein
MARIFELQRKSTLALRQRRAALLRHARLPAHLVRGSFIEQFLKCGKPNCACHRDSDKRHGPYYLLMICLGVGKVRKFMLKDPAQREQAHAASTAYTQFMEQIEELSQINAELIRRGDDLLPSAAA